ncbi:LacI family DNA-binding transcriptional regulator [Streptomyces sp. MBT67]|uniref:LacI family DNA-binding transcriptional regulator n=1 Tax=Streptomyces TaxID=1883 RepID=UPI00190AEEAB|nr:MULTISPECIES: LacI family DNA-binding transcriptional regulator [unclassified Streptomyces]MBK3534402.1 LacI family DNA-binding transcriptional regulator [Streptomyces sp. MBT72]MBK3540116.1 LacI family DNA-binding transcriptional regulator [Streptomyces sp. MBT67]MBK3554682.1 LacI family DNA-binding transcriptional regulator [Streptomyces sp. MBT61]MBK6033458.1 LacI family DNA-binding transcriptional regulator [Streptomyces sp. MBT59]
MTSRTVTLLDVARAAGVSKSTVSDALQGSGRVAEATRDRVRAVAEELGYRPNSAARRLRRASTGAVGLHLPATATRLDYYMNLAFGAVERAQEDGLDMVLLAPSGAAGGRIASRVDGLLVIDPEAGDSAVPGLLDAGVPVVTGERYLGPSAGPSAAVVCDNAASLTALLDHVTERGARRPAVLAPSGSSAWATALRATARSWGLAHGVEVALRTVPFAATPAEAEETTRALLTADPAIDAVICAPDGSAPGVLRAATALGREVGTVGGGGGTGGSNGTGGGTPPEPGTITRSGTPPEPGTIARSGTPPEPGTIARSGPGLLVAACVDGPATRGAEPPVTAVDLRPAAYGRACAELLCDILADRAAPDTVRRHAWSLETRASTGSPG